VTQITKRVFNLPYAAVGHLKPGCRRRKAWPCTIDPLPLVNWSAIGGDLRIAHLIAIHAIPIVPLFAFILSQMAPIPAVKYRRMAITALAIVVSTAVGATFVQAALVRPLIPWVR